MKRLGDMPYSHGIQARAPGPDLCGAGSRDPAHAWHSTICATAPAQRVTCVEFAERLNRWCERGWAWVSLGPLPRGEGGRLSVEPYMWSEGQVWNGKSRALAL